MAWLDTAIEQAGEAITVDVSDMGLGVDSIQIKPLSAKEYQALKAHLKSHQSEMLMTGRSVSV